MKKLFENKPLGFFLSFGAAIVAAVGAVAFVAVYMLTAGDSVDRVFNWVTMGFILGGGAVGILTEILGLRFGPLLTASLLSVGFANHLVELAYPLADVLTGVPFFGGNFTLALIFAIIFGVAVICTVIAAFMEHTRT